MALDKQIKIFSVDTSNFYSNKELYLHKLNHKIRAEKNDIRLELSKYKEKLIDAGLSKNEIESLQKKQLKEFNYPYKILDIISKYLDLLRIYNLKQKKANKTKNSLLLLLENKVNQNIQSKGKYNVRKLRFINKHNQLIDYSNNEKNIIYVFDSALTRIIGIKPDEFTDAFIVVQVYYFSIIKDLIYFGFTYNGERYRYFTSSAGQIRTKKCVFIKESIWQQSEKKIMCGLTIDSINAKGGSNPNKYLAYLALTNSATDVWKEFDIDKAIVIDDFETEVHGTYDLIDDTDYSIKRIIGNVPIPHTDGAGMMLPVMGKNRMVRLPWIKGLLGVFDFIKFIESNNCSPVIKDIYGKEHDVITEDIQVIFTKSQFKMHKYYDSWEQYKKFFKEYHCDAGCTNVEENRIPEATINYQMLQTLTDITDSEIEKIIQESNTTLSSICDSVENIQRLFGISPYNIDKTDFQKSIELYPNLLNDISIKSILKDIKDSMVKRYKSGKLKINGKYTFILPDFYAACEYWFGNIKNPKGLLNDKEVFCWLFRKADKLDCLRSPHLYKEHAIRKNLAYKECKKQKQLREWFTTDAIYTSTHDLISKVLQFDVDGDKSLVVADKTFIKIAERNMKNIVPLYYNMRKANPSLLTNQTIYDGLNAAFVGGNIGTYANNITKIWNSDVFVSGTEEEQQEAIDIIKILCMEHNFIVDYAKTLYKPKRPKEIHEKIKSFININVPHFFVYAKDKEGCQVAGQNQSFVNKLENLIINPRINCRKIGLGKIDYRLMMSNPDIKYQVSFFKNGKLDEKNTEPLIVEYLNISKECYYKLNYSKLSNLPKEILTKSQLRQNIVFEKIIAETKDKLSKFGYDENEIVDILVKFLYDTKPDKHKTLFWNCYGNIIYQNLSKYIKPRTKSIQCMDCGKWFYVSLNNKKSCRCEYCKKEYRNEYQRNLMRKKRC